jgi:hypothetical protein
MDTSPASDSDRQLTLAPKQESIVQSTVEQVPVYKSDGTPFGDLVPTRLDPTLQKPLFTQKAIAEAKRLLERGGEARPLAETPADLSAKYGS